jgi:hypothetical protein
LKSKEFFPKVGISDLKFNAAKGRILQNALRFLFA